jgi:hypothetical protein
MSQRDPCQTGSSALIEQTPNRTKDDFSLIESRADVLKERSKSLFENQKMDHLFDVFTAL